MTAALIIAAGKTDSSGGFSPLQQVGSISVAQRLILVFKLAGVQRVVLVGGEEMDALERHIAHMGVVCLRQPHQGGEMLDSVKLGLEYLQGRCRRVLITPVDVPLFSVDTVKCLMESEHKLAVPSHQGRGGHPLLLSAKLFAPVLGYTGAGGLAGAVKAMGQPVRYMDVADAGVLLDVQRQGDDYEALLRRHSLQALRPEIKVSLAREKVFFGPGPFMLLSLIDETESIRLACGQMGISYSKAWKMIENAEQQLGQKVVHRSRGGHTRGKTVLTEEGAALLRRYRDFARECTAQAQALFEKYFPCTP